MYIKKLSRKKLLSKFVLVLKQSTRRYWEKYINKELVHFYKEFLLHIKFAIAHRIISRNCAKNVHGKD